MYSKEWSKNKLPILAKRFFDTQRRKRSHSTATSRLSDEVYRKISKLKSGSYFLTIPKLKKIGILTIFVGISLFLYSCQKEKTNHVFYTYTQQIKPLECTITNASFKSSANYSNEKSFLYAISPPYIELIDIEKDSVLLQVRIPDEVASISSISGNKSGSFAFLGNEVSGKEFASFYIYKDGILKQIKLADFKDNYYILSYVSILYFEEDNKIIAGALTYEGNNENKRLYDCSFLRVYNLNDFTSQLIDFKYPKGYLDGKLGPPRVNLRKSDKDNIVISFEYDRNTYLLDKKNYKLLATVDCSSKDTKLRASYPIEGTKQDRLDAILKNSTRFDSYGPSFWSETQNTIYRTYKPELPERDKSGRYNTSKKKSFRIIKKQINENINYEYILPGNMYFTTQDWSINYETENLNYAKILRKKDGSRSINIMSHFFHDF